MRIKFYELLSPGGVNRIIKECDWYYPIPLIGDLVLRNAEYAYEVKQRILDENENCIKIFVKPVSNAYI